MPHELITDIAEVRRLAEQKHDENWRFRIFVKSRAYPEKRFRQIAGEIAEQIDCRQCANCCREATVAPNDQDIDRLATYLGISREEFREGYMMRDTDGEAVLRQTENGCVFLDGNVCTVYDYRPRICRNYPHLVRSDWSLASRMISVVSNSRICPIVYNALEAYKEVMQFQRSRRNRNSRRRPRP